MSAPKAKASHWPRTLKIIAAVAVYMVPFFWMKEAVNYPDSFGVHITAHGKAGAIEAWWYSYLLLERPNVRDLALFAYMWVPIVGSLALFTWKAIGARRGSFRIFANSEEAPDDASSR